MKKKIINYHLILIMMISGISFFNNNLIFSQSKSLDKNIKKLQTAYPDFIKSIDQKYVFFTNGSKLAIDNSLLKKTFDDTLNHASIRDMMIQTYTKGKNFALPLSINYDPGRIRNEEFFLQIYGKSQTEIKKNLTSINWFGRNIQVTKINKVNEKLLSVKKELEKLPEKLHKYFTKTAGAFNFRKIAGTERLSNHSFGIAIDLNTEFSHYWRNAKPDKDGKYKYRNIIPIEIVEIFEKYGFIWGGKWYHYDTMHFEYRPELLID